jgi:hypothetical protein
MFMRQSEEITAEEGIKGYLLIGNIIDKASVEIFLLHKNVLLSDPINYIIQAVWGAKAEGELSPGQEEINKKILCALQQIRDVFTVANLDLKQKFALDYLVRGSISGRVMHMTAIFQNEVNKKFSSAFESLERGSELVM